MENFSFFDELGLGPVGEPKEEPKKAAKKEKKPAAKKETSKCFSVKLPVTVLARGFRYEIADEGTGSMEISQVFKELYDAGYVEVSIDGISCAYDDEKGILYITTNGLLSDDENTLVEFKEGVITVVDGMHKCELSLDSFSGKDEDEITVLDVSERWIATDGRYQGCRLVIADMYAYPCFNADLAAEAQINLPCDILVNGEWITLSDGDFAVDVVHSSDVIKKLAGEANNAVEMVLYSNANQSAYFLGYKQKKAASVKKGCVTSSKGAKKVAQEKYALPLQVFIATFGRTYNIGPDDFEGKSKVTLQNVRNHFKSVHKIFADESRKLDAIYIEEENLLSLNFISGKKGAGYVAASDEDHLHYGDYELLRTTKEMLAAITKPFFRGTLVNINESPDGSIRVESFPIGTFFLTQDDRTGDIKNMRFELKLPKIPGSFLRSIIAYFKAEMANEAYVKICYNTTSNEFFLVTGKRQATPVSVHYELPTGLFHERNIVQVMDVHSHNTMPAYFSNTDDADECYPGLFCVIGRLDREEPEVRIRAGYEGDYILLKKSDIFVEET